MSRTGYYNEQMRTDERLAAMMKEVQKRVRKGEPWAKGRKGNGISVGRELKAHGLDSKWTGFVMAYDYDRRITEARIGKERHEWQVREEVRLALRNPARAAKQYGLPAPGEAKAPRAVKPREAEPQPFIQPCDVKLMDWAFSSGAKALRLRWQVKEKGAQTRYAHYDTYHALEPQVYAYEDTITESGQPYVKRTYLSGDFKNGSLTKAAQVRIVNEGRAQVEKALRGRSLERYKDTLATMTYLMR